MKLFLDANVLFTAAHNPDGKASFVIEMARDGIWQVVTSRFAIEEARRNLKIKFPGGLHALDELLATVGTAPAVIDDTCPIELPQKDVPIFLAAVRAGCTHLLTGDRKDFGRYMNAPDQTSGVVIQTVAEFLEETETRS